MSNLIDNETEFSCRGCGLLCDDLIISGSRETGFQSPQTCQRGLEWLNRSSLKLQATESLTNSAVFIEAFQNQFASLASPLICGLQGLTLETERAACQWAEDRRAYVCLGLSVTGISAAQRYGSAGCSLGEVRHRCELILAGNVDILAEWPRFEERFLNASGRFRGETRPRLVYLGTPENLQHAAAYDESFCYGAEIMSEVFIILRREIQGIPPENGSYRTAIDDKDRERLRVLAADLKTLAYPVLFANGGDDFSLQWTKLTMETLEVARLHKITVKPGSSGGSPTESLLAYSGFPDTVRFASTGVEYDPLPFQADRLVAQQRVDGCLYLADRLTEKWLPILIAAHQQGLPVAVVTEEMDHWEKLPPEILKILTARAGQHVTGTMLRADGMPIPVKSFCESNLPTAFELLQR